jgi:hypothetical protein
MQVNKLPVILTCRQPAFEAPRMGAGQAAGKDAREKAPVAVKLAAALLYGGASVAMNFVNKCVGGTHVYHSAS